MRKTQEKEGVGGNRGVQNVSPVPLLSFCSKSELCFLHINERWYAIV